MTNDPEDVSTAQDVENSGQGGASKNDPISKERDTFLEEYVTAVRARRPKLNLLAWIPPVQFLGATTIWRGLLTENPSTRERTTRGDGTSTFSFIFEMLQAILMTNTPLVSITVAIYHGFLALQKHRIVLTDIDTFHDSCPEDGRRTRTSAYVKLFAAIITTIGVNGHVGFLTGSESWRREIARVAETIMSPLSQLLSTTVAALSEIGIMIGLLEPQWVGEKGIKERLAMILACRVYIPSTVGMPLRHVNSQHIEAQSLPRDLKWFSRAFGTMILLAQYAQSMVLLTRRLMTDTAAVNDVAMFFLAISGLVGLLRAFAMYLINTQWNLLPDTQSCANTACRLDICVKNRTRRGDFHPLHTPRWLGGDLYGKSKRLLYMLIAGLLQLAIIQQDKRDSGWRFFLLLLGMSFFWEATTACLNTINIAMSIWTAQMDVLNKQESDAASSSTGSSGALPTKLRSNAGFLSFLLRPAGMIMFTVGMGCLAILGFALFCQMFFFFWPSVRVYTAIAQETAAWASWDIRKACPQLWKDWLEDELWWF